MIRFLIIIIFLTMFYNELLDIKKIVQDKEFSVTVSCEDFLWKAK